MGGDNESMTMVTCRGDMRWRQGDGVGGIGKQNGDARKEREESEVEERRKVSRKHARLEQREEVIF